MSGGTNGEGGDKPVMIVTGGGRGIGAAICEAAAAAGYRVAINYVRDDASANALVATLRARGDTCEAFRADVGKSDEAARLFADVDRAFGRVDVLINNAGILEVIDIATLTDEALERNYRANVFGAYYCAREAVLRMSTKRGGRGGAIVNVSSVASRLGGLGPVYAGSKGAVDAFSLALSKDLGAQGIRVNAIRPGLIHTGIHVASGGVDRMLDIAKIAVPVGRAGDPGEVAKAVLWLASQDASYVNGACLDVAGGR